MQTVGNRLVPRGTKPVSTMEDGGTVLEGVQSWTNSLLDMIEYTHHQGALGSIAMSGSVSARWRAIDPAAAPTDDDIEIFPGLYTQRIKERTSGVAVRESVLRELHQAIRQKLGTTGLTLFSMETDLKLVMGEAFREGLDALTSEVGPGVKGGAPLTTVEHDNMQLMWNRYSRCRPDVKVPLCINATDDESSVHMSCFGKSLRGAPGGLHMWLSPSQQMVFDETGDLPNRGPCLLCIRAELQQLVLAYGGDVNPMRTATRPLVVPPFSILVDQPGGYRSECCISPADSQVVTASFPRNSGVYAVRCNERGDQWYVDQQSMVYNVPDVGLN